MFTKKFGSGIMKLLQGEVDFLTGGDSPRALCMNW